VSSAALAHPAASKARQIDFTQVPTIPIFVPGSVGTRPTFPATRTDFWAQGINFGIESSEVEIQSNVGRKPITQKQILETVALCQRLHLKTFCFFIIGLPGDTVDTILETIEFAIRLRPNWVQFNAASPLIGTKLRAWAVSKGLATEDDYAYRNCHEATTGNENLTREQVASLYKFAVFFERFLMNRGGILKDATRTGLLYRNARAFADWAAGLVSRTVFAICRSLFERSYSMPAPPQGQGAL